MGTIEMKKFNTKIWFLRSIVIAVAFLVVFLLLLNTLPIFTMTLGDGLALYGLILNIIIGIFTVWALFWAASEFSEAQIYPDLCLVIGAKVDEGIKPLINASDKLVGYDTVINEQPVSEVTIGLFLENTMTKAARFVRLILQIKDTPIPIEFRVPGNALFYKVNTNTMPGQVLFLQFGENLVVYKGHGVQLGSVRAVWPQGIHPEKINLNVTIHNLYGEPKQVEIGREIEWNP